MGWGPGPLRALGVIVRLSPCVGWLAAPRLHAIASLPHVNVLRTQKLEGLSDRADGPIALETVCHAVVRVEKRPFVITLACPERQLPVIKMNAGGAAQNAAGPAVAAEAPVKREPEI